MCSHTWALNHDYSFLLVPALFLTLISTHAPCGNASPVLFCLLAQFSGEFGYIWAQAGNLNSISLPEGTHQLNKAAPLCFGRAQWPGMQWFLLFTEPWRVFKNERFVVMLLLRIRLCSNIHAQTGCFLLLVLCNVLGTSIPKDSGLLVVISRHVSYSIELESDSESWSVWARPVMSCSFKYHL